MSVNLENKQEREKYWNDKAKDLLVGKTIKSVRYLTSEECEENMWNKRGLVITLNDGTEIIPGSDDEFNDTGVLHYQKKNEDYKCLPSLY
jgi:hypothetical protein